jgi:hypothetical protein
VTALSPANQAPTRARIGSGAVLIAVVAFAAGIGLGSIAGPATALIGSGSQGGERAIGTPAPTYDIDQIRAEYRRH